MDDAVRIVLERQNPWWFDKVFNSGIERPTYLNVIWKYLKAKEIILLTGVRRSGKSTLLRQVIKKIVFDGFAESILFIDFDDPLFQSKSSDPSFLTELVSEINSEKKIKFLFVDEIQSYDYWAQAIKTIHDLLEIKVFLSGSSSVLINSVIATKLSGRFFQVNIFPLSFNEFLEFNEAGKTSFIDRKKFFRKYLEFGGFPKIALEPDNDLKQDLLRNYFQTIYLKDIIYPNKLRDNKDLFELLYFFVSNVSNLFSFSGIAKAKGIAVDTVKDYLMFSEQAYLLCSVMKFDYSVKKQIVNPKKIYCIDTGLVNSVSFKFSENKGKLLENLVAMALLKKYSEIYYFKENNECDFIVKDKLKVIEVIQVSVSLENDLTRKRELAGLTEAMNYFKLDSGFILTENESEVISLENKKIIVMPAHEWLLKNQ